MWIPHVFSIQMMKMRVVSVDICNVYKYTLVDGGGDHGGGGDGGGDGGSDGGGGGEQHRVQRAPAYLEPVCAATITITTIIIIINTTTTPSSPQPFSSSQSPCDEFSNAIKKTSSTSSPKSQHI